MLLADPNPAPAVLAPGRERELWPDAAKGVLIALVVLWHTTRKHYAHLPWVPVPVQLAWEAVNVGLQPVRVPLFFAVSGLLAARSVRRPWQAVLRPRVLNGYWTYLVWLLLGSAFFLVGPPLGTAVGATAPELAMLAAFGGANVWYLYALAAYFLVTRAAARLPFWLALAGAAVLAVVADLPGIVPGYGNNFEGQVRNLVFFLVPALRPELLRTLVARARPRTAVAAGLAFLVASGGLEALDLARTPGVRALLGALGVVAGLLVAVTATRALPRAAARLGRLGRTTLPVYVLHLPLLALLHAAVLALPAPSGAVAATVGVAYPLLATALLTGAALVLHRLLERAGLGVLFAVPASLRPMRRTRTTT